MFLSRITPQNFRNLAHADVAFHEKTNIVVGRNGQGKTNLLEAIYFLATTKSFRTPRMASVARFESGSLFAAGALHRDGVEKTLSAGIETGELKRRVLMINGEKVTLAAYLNAMSVFAYSSARLEILRGAPEEKRRFLDRGIASINAAYLEQLTRYGRVLKQRNALLQSGTATPSSLDAWDAEFVAAAALVQRARATYADELAAAFATIVEEHAYHVRDVRLAYRPSAADDLRKLRRDELRARVSLAGPQRDTLEFTAGGRPAHEVLSGGELKMIVLLLKFAKLELFRARYDEPAVFLLDDVDAELDLEILEKLLVKLPSKTQVFATSAKERFLAVLMAGSHRRLLIENGHVTSTQDFR